MDHELSIRSEGESFQVSLYHLFRFIVNLSRLIACENPIIFEAILFQFFYEDRTQK